MKPIATRLSKSLYRYAVELDMLTQAVAYAEVPYDALDEMWRDANVRIAKTKGKVDVAALLQEERYRHLREEVDSWD